MRNSERGIEGSPSLDSPPSIPHSTFRIVMHRTSDFDYYLPPELIAQHPLPDRAASRLLVLDGPTTLAKYGETPLPPYIRRPPSPEDRARYQTVYAAHDGSVAAPTAGLHFTPELLQHVRASGTAVATLDLHVGPGTFKPVLVANLVAHPMHAEPDPAREA